LPTPPIENYLQNNSFFDHYQLMGMLAIDAPINSALQNQAKSIIIQLEF
jgi:hypothetical protein